MSGARRSCTAQTVDSSRTVHLRSGIDTGEHRTIHERRILRDVDSAKMVRWQEPQSRWEANGQYQTVQALHPVDHRGH